VNEMKNNSVMQLTGALINKSTTSKDSDKRIIRGYASVPVVDIENEVISTSAYDSAIAVVKSRMKQNRPLPIFIEHRRKELSLPVGAVVNAGKDSKGLWFEGKIAKGAIGDSVWDLIKENFLYSVSMGGEALKKHRKYDRTVSKDITVIDDLIFRELSLTGLPVNEEAVFSIAKSINPSKKAKVSKKIMKSMGRLDDAIDYEKSKHDFIKAIDDVKEGKEDLSEDQIAKIANAMNTLARLLSVESRFQTGGGAPGEVAPGGVPGEVAPEEVAPDESLGEEGLEELKANTPEEEIPVEELPAGTEEGIPEEGIGEEIPDETDTSEEEVIDEEDVLKVPEGKQQKMEFEDAAFGDKKKNIRPVSEKDPNSDVDLLKEEDGDEEEEYDKKKKKKNNFNDESDQNVGDKALEETELTGNSVGDKLDTIISLLQKGGDKMNEFKCVGCGTLFEKAGYDVNYCPKCGSDFTKATEENEDLEKSEVNDEDVQLDETLVCKSCESVYGAASEYDMNFCPSCGGDLEKGVAVAPSPDGAKTKWQPGKTETGENGPVEDTQAVAPSPKGAATKWEQKAQKKNAMEKDMTIEQPPKTSTGPSVASFGDGDFQEPNEKIEPNTAGEDYNSTLHDFKGPDYQPMRGGTGEKPFETYETDRKVGKSMDARLDRIEKAIESIGSESAGKKSKVVSEEDEVIEKSDVPTLDSNRYMAKVFLGKIK